MSEQSQLERAEAVPCPCGRCSDYLIRPWFYMQGAGVDKATADEIVQRLNGWTLMSDKKPEPGQLCVIQFRAERSSLRLCHYDNRESWAARNVSLDEDALESIDFTYGAWFTECDDEEDWWEDLYVFAWMAVPSPGSVS